MCIENTPASGGGPFCDPSVEITDSIVPHCHWEQGSFRLGYLTDFNSMGRSLLSIFLARAVKIVKSLLAAKKQFLSLRASDGWCWRSAFDIFFIVYFLYRNSLGRYGATSTQITTRSVYMASGRALTRST